MPLVKARPWLDAWVKTEARACDGQPQLGEWVWEAGVEGRMEERNWEGRVMKDRVARGDTGVRDERDGTAEARRRKRDVMVVAGGEC